MYWKLFLPVHVDNTTSRKAQKHDRFIAISKSLTVLLLIYGQHKLNVVRYDKLSLICTEKTPVEFISFTLWKCKACLDYVLFGESGFPQENFSEQGNYDDS